MDHLNLITRATYRTSVSITDIEQGTVAEYLLLMRDDIIGFKVK